MTRRLPILAAALAALALPAVATAGSYSVQSCRSAGGAPLPVRDDAGGWRPQYDAGTFAEDRCSGSDPQLIAYAGDNVPVRLDGRAQWRFAAPPGTYISAFRIAYYGYSRPYDGANQGIVGIVDSEHGSVVRHEGAGTVGPTVAAGSGRHAEWVGAYASCDGPADHPPCPRDARHAQVAVTRSVIELTDVTPPASGAPGGNAVAATDWTGVERLTAPVSDVGGGLARWSLAVDGAERLGGPVDPASPTCTDAGGGLFPTPRPCPASADLLLDLDAAALPAGTHDMTVRVLDVAGNARTVFSGRRTVVPPGAFAAPAAPGVPLPAAVPAATPGALRLTARWARSRSRTLAIAYGARPAIRGRLTHPDGAPVGGAAIGLFTRTLGRGRAVDAGGMRTRPDGAFTLVVRAGLPSSLLELRSRSGGARATLHLRVRAGLTLRARRRGRLVLLSGGLRGRPLPRAGKLVELQARTRAGRWLTFRTVRADARGRFRTRYRLRTRRPATFALRARSRASGDYPYATGSSGRVRVQLR